VIASVFVAKCTPAPPLSTLWLCPRMSSLMQLQPVRCVQAPRYGARGSRPYFFVSLLYISSRHCHQPRAQPPSATTRLFHET